jgi:hypothetical protein
MITHVALRTHEITANMAKEKVAFDKRKNFFTSKLDLNSRKKLVKCNARSIAFYGAENRKFGK